ncbi:stage III sporulation protein SpoAB [Bacillus coahuilensis m2-6]|uniref:Stage III sporulation protein SpoAB n=1 Tax=Bacillus coahuilensis p1.1.43 TaxID=1150625 RepID=A0A147K7R9_9BACI|nr:stage III sporulation protein SpoIIIAB [Bacillus coahuilensis]KUP06183.1 stage III sporulation protein SpoAB [Bacillus coahuilensis p1.1.43]KUP07373.1 stage III sporulation protein SpoAB [Bacillus coahuilensis m2-6]
MVKLIGAAFIIIATTWAGLQASSYLSERPKQLRSLKSALQSLEAEILYSHTPLHEAARKLSRQLTKPLSWFFEAFSSKLTTKETTVQEAWEESLEEVWKFTALKKSELEILKQFGESLGRYDIATQQKQIVLALTHLERVEKEAHETQQKYEKMAKSLGVLTGLLVVILLL